jgi:hypothetical protein
MGWVDKAVEIQKENESEAKKNALLIVRANKAGVDFGKFLRNVKPGTVAYRNRMAELREKVEDAEADQRRAQRRSASEQEDEKGPAKDDDGQEIPDAPGDLSASALEIWNDPSTTAAERQQMLANPANRTAPVAANDPFEDALYREKGGAQIDDYMLDMNDIDGLSPQSYRNTLLRETGPESSQYTSTPMSKLGGWGKAAGRKLHVGKTKGITPIKYIAKVMSMPEDELEEFQRDLYAAGFYGSVVGQKDDEPLWGAPDLPTKQAVRALAEMTMTFKGRLSILEVLDRLRKAA